MKKYIHNNIRIAGVVVLYNSSLDCLENINTYLSQLDTLFIIDNSDYKDEFMINKLMYLPNTQYIHNFGNKGIAYALNQAAKHAINQDYDYLLTMDDDSSVPTYMIEEMKQFIFSQAQAETIGIVSVAHLPSTLRSKEPNPVLYTMTCGNLLNLNAYKDVGSFREDFFIDHVDHEYSLRLNSWGYTVTELPAVRINHPLGEKKKYFGITYVSRSPVRQYYITRNGIIAAKQYFSRYPFFTFKIVNLIIKEWIKIIFEQNNRRERISFVVKGMYDGLRGRTGKY